MRQIILIPVICYLALLLEFTLYNLFGRWGDPHVLLLVVIFFNLYSGIRFSIWAALWAGAFKDCFSTMPFGTNIFVYVACAYLSLAVRRYCYERGSNISRIWMVLCVVTAHTVIMGFLHKMTFEEVSWLDVWRGIWLPEVAATAVVSVFVFDRLKALAQKLKF
ncbi:MAG: rod shape-determining protein MreD [Candidatus Omnitrophica bacterium]|nr:rod shape-determining protein MreD [Candidatus Omnitrophota bacterium]